MGNILSRVVDRKVGHLQAATLQLKAIIYEVYSETLRTARSSCLTTNWLLWRNTSNFSALSQLFCYILRTVLGEQLDCVRGGNGILLIQRLEEFLKPICDLWF